MNSTIEFHDLHKMNQQLLSNSELFFRTGRKKSLRLNLKHLGSLSNVDTKTPTTQRFSTPTPRQQSLTKLPEPVPTSNPSATIDLSLPKLSKSSTKSNRKIDRTYLQQWLNEALEEDDGAKGPLRGVRKFLVDRRHLLAQNISNEEVDKLYQSLFMYSHGLRKVIGSILNNNEEMVIRFWRVFLKLIEKSSEFQNMFSVIDRRYSASIEDLKKLVMKRDQQLKEQKEGYQEKMKDIERDLANKTEEISSLKFQKFVLQNNFELTDEAFNQEVGLRLRFEQKINAINTAYSQLKIKYTRLIEQIRYHRESTLSHSEKERQHIDEKCAFESSLLHKQKLIDVEKQKNKIKQDEIQSLKIQVLDQQQKRLDIIKAGDEQEISLKEVLIKEKEANLKLAQEIDKVKAARVIVKQKSTQIQKLKKDLDKQRKNIEEAYEDCYKLRQQINSINKQIEDQKNIISLLNKKAQQAESQSKIAKQHASEVCEKNEILQKQIEFFRRKTTSIQEGMAGTQKTIQSLRTAKQKYQKMYKIIQSQQQKMLQTFNQANNKIAKLQDQKAGFILMLERKDHIAAQNQSRLKTDLDILRHKIQALDFRVKHKDGNLINLTQRYEKAKGQVSEKDRTIDRLQKLVFQSPNNLSKSNFEKNNLESKCQHLTQTIDNLKSEVQKLNALMIGLKKNNTSLSNEKTTLSHILDEKKKNTTSEQQTTKGLLRTYKELLQEKASYIHPMHYWDKEGFANRCQQTVDPLLKQISNLSQIVDKRTTALKDSEQQVLRIKKQFAELRNRVEEVQSQLNVKSYMLNKTVEESTKSSERIAKLQQQIQNKTSLLEETARKLANFQTQFKAIKEIKLAMKHQHVQTTHQTISQYAQTDFIEKQVRMASRETEFREMDKRATSRQLGPRTPKYRQTLTPRKKTESNHQQTPLPQKSIKFEEAEQQFISQNPMNVIEQSLGGEESPRKAPLNQEEPLESMYTLNPVPVKPEEGSISKPVKAAQSMKPVSNKDFSKALKLTFMRK